MLTELLLIYLIAIGAGLLGALVGIGGGIIVVPALTLIFNIPVHYAIAASLISVIATSVAGANRYVEQEITNLKLGMFLEIFTTTGALIGAFLALILHGWILSVIFGALVFVMAFYSFKNREEKTNNSGIDYEPAENALLNFEDTFYDKAEKKAVEYRVLHPVKGGFISMLAGIGSGLLGIGGGIIKVSVMNGYMKVPMKVAVATSKFMIGVTAAASAVLYFLNGAVNSFIVAPVALGTITGATLGSIFMNRIPTKYIKIIFIVVAGYLSVRMIIRGLSIGLNLM
ncbi:putative permease [Melioribacter roseus P3M-2]|uniref:Probable membrane transporter protein n=1 Tax=Melioribacter roseus (strain DSM 23840 / JCM 17771 / VKM B-2668 / P3M-2) TaxID=1191523 RepID=I6Z7J8_MELRP|nr:sulfite exporter TauE/SafE family protein [Melioribacter roseus]AFN75135.1 putative permease [Melioribacter roseus P3M-2]